ncbi:putative 3-demethylubiquinone-9 3-methyltransferase [Planoprotostelium fungivorum]|uniref:Putative 3-demethylubiquinone-9 3-methyltransferase n=1 Tax=Planoprotostelium fungivorum TaxID=1890364 RepID=A0A2P6MNY9_9EUKA|nr:putative 3-demethylubiquinone-9 3-methyltransferase [Planoprotostelium fungivorum]
MLYTILILLFLLFALYAAYILGNTVYHCLYLNYDRTKPVPESVTIDNHVRDHLMAFTHEIQWYDSLSWWQRDGIMGGLHAMNDARVGFFAKYLSITKEERQHEGRELTFHDIGCGGGICTEELAKRGFNMIGVDMSKESIRQATTHAREQGIQNVNYVIGNAYDLSFIPPASSDGVVMSDVLEHFHDLPTVVHQVSRMLRPGSFLVFDTMKRNWLTFIINEVVQNSPLAILPQHTHHWSLMINVEELKTLLDREGMELKIVKGLGIDVFSITFWKAFLLRKREQFPFSITDDVMWNYIGYAKHPTSASHVPRAAVTYGYLDSGVGSTFLST